LQASSNAFSQFYAVIELLGMLMADPRTAALFVLLIIAAVIDYRTYKIPNWLTMGGAAFALLYNWFVPFSFQHGFMWGLGGLAIGFAVTLPLYMLRAMGAGDVKLMAMAGAFLGIYDALYAVLATFIVGGVAAVGFGLAKRVMGRMLVNVKSSAQLIVLSALAGTRLDTGINAGQSVGKLPYGVSICIGTVGYVVMRQLGFI
jgi:prepilin peptidase CpaA